MSVWDLLAVLRRQMGVVVIGLLITAVAMVWAVRPRGVYSSVTTVTLTIRSSDYHPNPIISNSRWLIDLTGVVATIMGSEAGRLRLSSQNVTLSGVGVLDGFWVRQHDSGWQWDHQFDRPELHIQVTGPTAAVVAGRMAELLERVDAVLIELQADVPVGQRATARRDSDAPPVTWISGSRSRAIVMTALLGLSGTAMLAIFADWKRSPRAVRVSDRGSDRESEAVHVHR
ncbi:MAG: hypothetical protein ACOYEV_13580 [Candidatus Nanopelagicales bacterium]